MVEQNVYSSESRVLSNMFCLHNVAEALAKERQACNHHTHEARLLHVSALDHVGLEELVRCGSPRAT